MQSCKNSQDALSDKSAPKIFAESSDKSNSFLHRSLKERAVKYDGQLHLSDEIAWDKPTGAEVW